MLLKARQDLEYFPPPDAVHAGTVAYLASQLGLAAPPAFPGERRGTKTLYRYQAAVRAHLRVAPYGEAGERLVIGIVLAAETVSDPADLINRATEALREAGIDLPAYSTLERLVGRLRQARTRCRDELVEMMLRRIRRTQAAAREKLKALHDQHRETEEARVVGHLALPADQQPAIAAHPGEQPLHMR